LNFTITSFKADINGMLTQANGNKFSREQLDRIGKLKPGNSVILKDIRAKGPGGQEVTLSAVPLTLN
jgi:protein subunit release factor B